MAEYAGMTPTVVIGLGGTGKEIIIKIRRSIVETYGSLDALPIVSFLHVDTEQNAKVSEPQVVLKQDISLRPVEQVWAKVEDAKSILNRLSDYEFLAEWFPNQLRGTDSILAGAGQIRALGKMAFTLNYQQIKAAFDNAKSRIVGHEKKMLDTQSVQLDKGINIFIACSLSGGTGSGMFLDLAYNVRDWIPVSDFPQSSAYLVLPGAFSGLGDRVIANAYSALMEVNHYSKNDTRFDFQYTTSTSDRIGSQAAQDIPCNFCYLVGNSNDKVTFSSLNEVLEMVAQNIFLDFSSGFSQYKKLVRDNIRKHWSSPDPLGYPQNFITFGLSGVQYPVERVLNACTSRLAKEIAEKWANPRPVPAAMRDLIKTEILPNLGLAESENDHQILDAISLSNNSNPYSKEVTDWVSGLRKRRVDINVPFENLPRFVSVEQDKFDPHFNDADTDPQRWSDYYLRMWDNLSRLIPEKRQTLRQFIYEAVEDTYRGPRFAFTFLQVLDEVLLESRATFDRDRQKTYLPQEKSAANALQTLLKQIGDRANQFMLLNRKRLIDEDFEGTMRALESHYRAKIEVKSRALGVRLVDELREEVESLQSDVTAFDRTLAELQRTFADKELTYERETGTLTVNGILLYDPRDIKAVYDATLGERRDFIMQAVTDNVAEELQPDRLFDLYRFDALRQKDFADRIFGRCLDEFVNSSHLQVSTARKFLELYPTNEAQEAQLQTTYEKSEPFLRFSQEQMRRGWDDRAEKRQKLVGIQGGNKPTDRASESLLPIVRKTTTLTDKDIRPLNSPHHIWFVNEVGAFPLRLIEGMERMRSVYRTVSQSDKNPLHTHQNFRQFADIMPATQTELTAKQDLVLARALGLVVEAENQVSQFQEIRFLYRDSITGLEKTEVLGATWKEAEEALVSDRNRRVRDTLHDRLQAMGKDCRSKSDKLDMYRRLTGYLETQGQILPGGRDNPQFPLIEKAVEDYLKRHSLVPDPAELNRAVASPATIATSAATAADTTDVPPVNSNLEKYEKLVQTCYRKGEPTEKELQMLATFQSRYGVSGEEAQQLIAKYSFKQEEDAAYTYGVMFRAFLENDGEIDLDERAQLMELQDELQLSNDQVEAIEANIYDELGIDRP
ncbi:MAG: tubulin-like doman-containing protein [Cyanobacteria bacterium P01_F01_bin.33]